ADMASDGALVLVTGGSLTTAVNDGEVTAGGNVLLQADAATSDVTLNAAVTSTGGHVSVDAGRNLEQNAIITVEAEGMTIDMVAGGAITMAAAAETSSENGNVRLQAGGSISVGIIDAGEGNVSLVSGGSILDAQADDAGARTDNI